MQRLFFLALAVSAAVAVPLSSDNDTILQQFAVFRKEFNRTYENDTEAALRFDVFAKNIRTMQSMNDEGVEYGINELSDWTDEEYKRMLGYRPRKGTYATENQLTRDDIPRRDPSVQKVDWRDKGLVTRVKNQGQCGSCWSFGTTGVIEGAWAKAGNKLTSLSEAEFVDCDTVDAACDGGNQADALDFAIKHWNGDVEPAITYPYIPHKAPCLRIAKAVGATVKSWKEIKADEDAIADAVAAYGPVTIGVDAASKSWQTYKSGVMCSELHRRLDHAVLIVGFDTTASPPYWIVKNSWGTSWGEKGYLRIKMGHDCFGIKKDVQAAFA